MSWIVERSPDFKADFALQAEWYLKRGGAELVWRYEEAVEATLAKLARLGPRGRSRRFRAPQLRGIRALTVEPPFQAHLIFYRANAAAISVERVIHGARDLPRRLRQPPGA